MIEERGKKLKPAKSMKGSSTGESKEDSQAEREGTESRRLKHHGKNDNKQKRKRMLASTRENLHCALAQYLSLAPTRCS